MCNWKKWMLLFYHLWCHLWISYFRSFPFLPFYSPIPAFYADIPTFYAKIICYSSSTCCTARSVQVGWVVGGVGSHGWHGGIPVLIRVFMQARDLTFQTDSRFRIPVRLLFPQGTGESSSVDHTWVGPRNCDFKLTVYPLLYLQKWSVPFRYHEPTQLRKYDQGLPS